MYELLFLYKNTNYDISLTKHVYLNYLQMNKIVYQ